jgi:3-deoxy-manno-octulosonate cytidylyltransferase (CMP-KDO synthetase)
VKIVGIIPARFASTRFPGKPLVDILGKSMIQRVYNQASKAKCLDEVIVATDDQRIRNEVLRFGGRVKMTRADHKNGTERCNEIAEVIEADYIINIQGDEPFIQPELIDQLCGVLDEKILLATIFKRIEDEQTLHNPNVVKVVKSKQNNALYFSRNAIPFLQKDMGSGRFEQHDYWRHIGIYAYQKLTLAQIVKLEQSKLEKAESLEQLRWLEHGYQIKLAETTFESKGVDTPADLAELIKDLDHDKI